MMVLHAFTVGTRDGVPDSLWPRIVGFSQHRGQMHWLSPDMNKEKFPL